MHKKIVEMIDRASEDHYVQNMAYAEVNYEKLVKIIVQECIVALDRNDPDFNTAKEFMLKKHFGMEE